MQVTETLNEGLKRGYAITVTAAELDAKVNEKLVEAQPEVEMKGFRKGKVPMALLKKQFGPRVLGEAMQESIDGAMSKHFDETGDRPAVQPEIKMTNEDWKEGDDVEVSVSYENLPTIPDVDLKGIKLEKLVVKAEDKDVQEALANLAENAQNFEDRKKGSKAKDGDQVVIAIRGRRFTRGEQEVTSIMQIAATYSIEASEGRVKMVRQGDIDVSYPNKREGERLSIAELTNKTFMTGKFEGLFKQEILGEGLDLPERWTNLEDLKLEFTSTDKGWLSLGWN